MTSISRTNVHRGDAGVNGISAKIETYRVTKVKMCLVKHEDYEENFFMPPDVGVAIKLRIRPSPIWQSEEFFEFNYFQIGQHVVLLRLIILYMRIKFNFVDFISVDIYRIKTLTAQHIGADDS